MSTLTTASEVVATVRVGFMNVMLHFAVAGFSLLFLSHVKQILILRVGVGSNLVACFDNFRHGFRIKLDTAAVHLKGLLNPEVN